MAEFTNPPLLTAAPTNGQVPVFNAAGEMVPTAIGSLPAAVIPQAPPTEVTQTSVNVVQTAPTTGAYGFTSAQAVAVLAQIDALVADVAALIVENDALTAALVTAGILS
jgi:hypothetical protein